jgi:hypothetical protein
MSNRTTGRCQTPITITRDGAILFPLSGQDKCSPRRNSPSSERARHMPARIVLIERTRRRTAYRNMLKRYSAKAALERELERAKAHRVPTSHIGVGAERAAKFTMSEESRDGSTSPSAKPAHEETKVRYMASS